MYIFKRHLRYFLPRLYVEGIPQTKYVCTYDEDHEDHGRSLQRTKGLVLYIGPTVFRLVFKRLFHYVFYYKYRVSTL